MANTPDPSRLIVPDHSLGGGLLPTLHTRYVLDAAIVMFGVFLFTVSMFLISEPDIAAMSKKLLGAGKDVAAAALL